MVRGVDLDGDDHGQDCYDVAVADIARACGCSIQVYCERLTNDPPALALLLE